jgi:hypothetical protein
MIHFTFLYFSLNTIITLFEIHFKKRTDLQYTQNYFILLK